MPTNLKKPIAVKLPFKEVDGETDSHKLDRVLTQLEEVQQDLSNIKDLQADILEKIIDKSLDFGEEL